MEIKYYLQHSHNKILKREVFNAEVINPLEMLIKQINKL